MNGFTIPPEFLFTALAGLVSVIYLDLKSALNELRKGATHRDILLVQICAHLKLPFTHGDDND